MKSRKRNSRFRALVDGKVWKFEWSVAGETLRMKELGKRTKYLSISPTAIVDSARGQMTFALNDTVANT